MKIRYFGSNLLNVNEIIPFVRDLVSIFLLVGILFFGIKGILILSFQTSSPMMGVSSGSMNHKGNGWKEYYINKGIKPENFPFQKGLQKGDLVFVQGVDSLGDIQVGDVVVWQRKQESIIHRVVNVNLEKGYFDTKGDANPGYAIERRIHISDVIGKAVFSIPYLGYPSIWTD